jgi:uncharacterized protein YbjT (DUF2867 family)
MVTRTSSRLILSRMNVVVAGGHGRIGRSLSRLLAAHGDRARGLIRDPRQATDLEADGAEPVVCDLEAAGPGEVAKAIAGADAVVFAAGAGPGSGAARKRTMDRDGAIKLIEAARAAGVDRYVMVSSVGAESPPAGDDVFSEYLRAKADADAALVASDRSWTIVRPGMLTDDPGTNLVRVSTEPFRGQVSRDDVAALLALVLQEPASIGHTLYLSSGEDSVADALGDALGQ